MIWARVHSRYQRAMARTLFRRDIQMRNSCPIISFTFDDFPRSAVHVGARILKDSGARGTFYASLGLMGQQAPTGEIFVREDLDALVRDGHEIGCHTYAHYDAWATPARTFEASVIQNARFFREYLPH